MNNDFIKDFKKILIIVVLILLIYFFAINSSLFFINKTIVNDNLDAGNAFDAIAIMVTVATALISIFNIVVYINFNDFKKETENKINDFIKVTENRIKILKIENDTKIEDKFEFYKEKIKNELLNYNSETNIIVLNSLNSSIYKNICNLMTDFNNRREPALKLYRIFVELDEYLIKIELIHQILIESELNEVNEKSTIKTISDGIKNFEYVFNKLYIENQEIFNFFIDENSNILRNYLNSTKINDLISIISRIHNFKKYKDLEFRKFEKFVEIIVTLNNINQRLRIL